MGLAIVLTLMVVAAGAVVFCLVGPELWRPEL
jgi:hypothetical protein